MARRKKKRPGGATPAPSAEPKSAPASAPAAPETLQRPFAAALAGVQAAATRRSPPSKKHERALGVSRGAPRARAVASKPDYGWEDRTSFSQEMADVSPLGGKAKRRPRGASRADAHARIEAREEGGARRAAREAAEEAARARLDSLVGGGVTFEIRRDDEGGVFGRREGAHPAHLADLRRGVVVPDARLDLHGLGADEAGRDVRRFVRESHRGGHRVVLIVHGKGRHSDGRQGVLEDRVVDVLSRGGAAPVVLAFSSAPERLGGRGAIVVRLGER